MFAIVLEDEVGGGLGPQLCALAEPQQARHLAGLEEVEHVGAGGRRGAVALDALQGRAARHCHLQLHVLALVLVEVHLWNRSR